LLKPCGVGPPCVLTGPEYCDNMAGGSASTPNLHSYDQEEDHGGLGLDFADGDMKDNAKARSACIYSDPKMREMKHYMRSHQHEVRLREAAELEKRTPSASGLRRGSLRSEGAEEMDAKMKSLSKQEAELPYVMRTSELPESFREEVTKETLTKSLEERMALLRRMDRYGTRLGWRESMDHSLRRLMVDLDLSKDERLKEYETKKKDSASMMSNPTEVGGEDKPSQQSRFAQARCDHLDKIFKWYEAHGRKEARKEKEAPPYLRYNPQQPVMPGSLRVAPMINRQSLGKSGKPGELGQSSSSPALLAAGTAATAT